MQLRIVLLWSLGMMVACGDDESPTDGGVNGPRLDAMVAGGSGGAGGNSGTGGRDQNTGGAFEPPACEPQAHEPGSCLACVMDVCCEECRDVLFCGEEVECVAACFADPDDAGVSEDPIAQLIACSEACGVLDYVRRNLYACASGSVRPIFDEPMRNGDPNFVEGNEDDGGTVTDGCRAECFPTWPAD